jgi:hypothetical protein
MRLLLYASLSRRFEWGTRQRMSPRVRLRSGVLAVSLMAPLWLSTMRLLLSQQITDSPNSFTPYWNIGSAGSGIPPRMDLPNVS